MNDLINTLTDHLDITILCAVIIAFLLSFIPKIDYFIDKLSKLFMLISVTALITLTILVSYEVIVRKLFHGGSIAIQELQWHLYDITFLFAIAYTLSHDKHVRVDIFYDKFPKKVKLVINFIAVLFFIVPLATLIFVEAIPFVQMSYAQHESSGDPGGLCCRWIIKSAIIWAFMMLYLQAVAELRKIYYKWRNQ
jgi:TRAP-type mannitol/chloroaromatic compound transport system permease small subunit